MTSTEATVSTTDSDFHDSKVGNDTQSSIEGGSSVFANTEDGLKNHEITPVQ